MGCVFVICWLGVARADGRVDAQEEAVRDRLVSGEEAANLLPADVHERLGSLPDLAQEVLTFRDEARLDFLSFVASAPTERDIAAAALRIDEALPRWASQASDADEAARRQRNGKGLRFEA